MAQARIHNTHAMDASTENFLRVYYMNRPKNMLQDQFVQAAREGKLQHVYILLELGVDINKPSMVFVESLTALDCSISFGHWRVTQLLLERGARMNPYYNLRWAGCNFNSYYPPVQPIQTHKVIMFETKLRRILYLYASPVYSKLPMDLYRLLWSYLS